MKKLVMVVAVVGVSVLLPVVSAHAETVGFWTFDGTAGEAIHEAER